MRNNGVQHYSNTITSLYPLDWKDQQGNPNLILVNWKRISQTYMTNLYEKKLNLDKEREAQKKKM